jgi:hypothetical protein
MAQSDHVCPACAECTSLEMPTFVFNECAPQQNESEICAIYITIEDPLNPGEALGGPTDWTQTADWATAIHNTTADKVRKLTVIGDLPEPEQEIRIVSKRRRVFGTKVFNLNATVDDVTDENYEAMQALECGYVVRIWYETIGGYLYGGAQGVRASIVKANAPLDRGQNTFERIEYGFLFEASCHPPRIETPIE